MSDLDRQATGAPDVPHQEEPYECEHDMLFTADFAGHLRPLGRCLFCELAEQGSKLPRWRKVEDELPPDDVSVLVAKSNGDVHKTCRYRGEWLCPGRKPEVTHWMPLPEPPQ